MLHSFEVMISLFSQKFFSQKEQKKDFQLGLNHNKYMVTDNAVYIGRWWFVCLFLWNIVWTSVKNLIFYKMFPLFPPQVTMTGWAVTLWRMQELDWFWRWRKVQRTKEGQSWRTLKLLLRETGDPVTLRTCRKAKINRENTETCSGLKITGIFQRWLSGTSRYEQRISFYLAL